MKQYKVGILGATGMVGQRFVTLLQKHPWFTVEIVAASPNSKGKTYGEAVAGRWHMDSSVPVAIQNKVLYDATADRAFIAENVDFVFSAMNLPGGECKLLEDSYARMECPVLSNDSAHRFTPDVPMIIPEINPEHAAVIPAFRKRMKTTRGFIAVKSNCSLQSYVPALHPLLDFGLERVLACTYQAVSGAGKTLETFPEMQDNVIPYIGGEEEKSEKEPLKIWGYVDGGIIKPEEDISITTQCIRVPVSNGHMAAVFASFREKPELNDIVSRWEHFSGVPQALALPSAPPKFLQYLTENNRPQPALDRNAGNGMSVSIGRLRPDNQYDIKFVCLSHNTLRGAAGGGVLMAELLCAEGYI